MFLLGAFLCSITTATLLSSFDSKRIEDAANNMITNAGEVANTSASNQDNGVLLEIVVLSGNISGNLTAIGQADAGNLSQGGVWLLWRHGAHTKADPTSLRTTLQVDGFPFVGDLPSRAFDKLIDGGHK